MANKKTIFVGLSGGVDSAVAAHRLQQAGHQVVGVFIRVWHPEFMVCNWEAERLDAMRVAAHLQIPFLTCDARREYKEEVAQYFIDSYQSGLTPNPDVLCNQQVKFGAFMRFAKEHGADAIATGHYARAIDGTHGRELHRGIDENKDQSYFLWSLSKEQLAFAQFPIGDTNKEQIREEAKAVGIPTALKKDSQGICFLGHVDIPEFLSHFIELSPGTVLDESGAVIGQHQGALVYTIGQRHGFSISTKDANRTPHFVVDRDLTKNTITVSETQPVSRASTQFKVTHPIVRHEIVPGDTLEAQFRYRQTPLPVKIVSCSSESIELELLSDTNTPANGQFCALYKKTLCVGGGTIVGNVSHNH